MICLWRLQYLRLPEFWNRIFWEGVMIVGEISLNGEIHGVAGVLPRVIRARELGLRFCVIPEENIREGNLVKDMPVFGVKSLMT